MDRRSFIRTLTASGGAAMLALPPAQASAQPALPGTAPSDDPFSGWSRPGADEADLRLRVLAYAVLAANPSNVQPWLVALTEPGALDLYVDTGRLLYATDPAYRQVHVGQGTFLENLALAAGALGQRADIRLFPRGAYDASVVEHRPVAAVRLTPDPAAVTDPLFEAIPARRSAKAPFDGAALSGEDLAGLAAAARVSGEGVALRFTSDASGSEPWPTSSSRARGSRARARIACKSSCTPSGSTPTSCACTGTGWISRSWGRRA